MSGPSGNWHYPRRRHVRVCRELAWGVCPAAPAWQALPVLPGGCTVRAARPRWRPDSRYGGFRGAPPLSDGVQVTGTLATEAWPQLAGLVLEMALERTGGEPASYCLDHFTPSDPRRCLGLMADRLRVRATAESGHVLFELLLRGKAEEPNAPLAEADFDYAALSPVAFTLARAAVTVDGASITAVEALTVEVRNHLAAGPARSGAAAFLAAGRREVRLELRSLDADGALDEALRGDAALAFEAVFSHPEGHSLTLALPVLHPEENAPDAGADGLARTVLRAVAGTDAGGDDITYLLTLSP